MSYTLVDFPISPDLPRPHPNYAARRFILSLLITASISFLLTSLLYIKSDGFAKMMAVCLFAYLAMVFSIYLNATFAQQDNGPARFRIDSKGIHIRCNGSTRSHMWHEISGTRIVEITEQGELSPQRRILLQKRAHHTCDGAPEFLPISGDMVQNLALIIEAGMEQWGPDRPGRRGDRFVESWSQPGAFILDRIATMAQRQALASRRLVAN